MRSNEHDHVAYALGYYHGRAEGVDQNPYDGDDDARHYYREGYDLGVAHYCHETHPEDGERGTAEGIKDLKVSRTILYPARWYLDCCLDSEEIPTQEGFLEFAKDSIYEDFSLYPADWGDLNIEEINHDT